MLHWLLTVEKEEGHFQEEGTALVKISGQEEWTCWVCE